MTAGNWIVPLSDVVVTDELVEAVTDAVRSGWWSAGPRVQEVEGAFCEATGAGHALAVSSCTAALHIAFAALDLGPGDEVVTPSLTFVAVANMIRQTGATPVLCDIAGAHDLNLDPDALERAVGPRTKAIVPLHYGGFPCDMTAVLDVAERHGVIVVEDAAHALGATTLGRQCGTLGAFGAYSFFSNKNLPIGEGGMLVTDDDELAARARLLRSHGMTTLTWDRHRGHASSYDVLTPGFNYRLDEIRAAMLLVQLRRLPAGNRRRAELADEYVSRLHGECGIEIAFADRDDRASAAHHLAVAVLPHGVDREAVRTALAESRIQSSVHYPPIHRFAAYADTGRGALPRTDAVADRLLTLPLYPTLSDEQLDLVATRLLEIVSELSSGTPRASGAGRAVTDASSAA